LKPADLEDEAIREDRRAAELSLREEAIVDGGDCVLEDEGEAG